MRIAAFREPTSDSAADDIGAAEQLGFQPCSRDRAALENAVDQHFHRVDAEALRLAVATSPSGSRKWFMPPTPASGSRMQAEIHEPRMVVSAFLRIVGHVTVALRDLHVPIAVAAR